MKTVLITGAGSGIGKAAAELFSEKGWRCILVGRNLEKLERVSTDLKHRPISFSIDLRRADVGTEFAQKMQSSGIAELNCLVNNAGVFSQGTLAEIQNEEWSSIFGTNLFGPARLTQALLPYFQDGQSSIVNVSSTLGHRPSANTPIYSASKAAMNNWTKSLALDLAPRRIRVNAVCPGIVDTPIHSFHSLERGDKEKALAQMGPLQPLGRIGKPEHVAQAIYFLASQDSEWTTGALLDVDGGINL